MEEWVTVGSLSEDQRPLLQRPAHLTAELTASFKEVNRTTKEGGDLGMEELARRTGTQRRRGWRPRRGYATGSPSNRRTWRHSCSNQRCSVLHCSATTLPYMAQMTELRQQTVTLMAQVPSFFFDPKATTRYGYCSSAAHTPSPLLYPCRDRSSGPDP